MTEKKNEMKFTILFSPANPDHVFAANRLNTQSRNNKANYLAQAIKFYEDNNGLDKNAIEKVVLDILNNQSGSGNVFIAEKNSGENLDEKLKETINSSLNIFRKSSN